MTDCINSTRSRVVVAYRRLGNGLMKQLIKNTASFFIHRMSRGVEEISFDGVRMRLCCNRMIAADHLVRDIAGYNLHRVPQAGQVVVDAGAYTGAYSIYAACKVGPYGRVLAFEPDPYNRMMLKRNIRLNGVRNITCVDKGLFSREAVLALDIQGFGSQVVESEAGCSYMNHVKVTTLDAEIERLGISRVDFVKMDVEGSEMEALQGCAGTIAKSTEIEFAVAAYHVVRGKQTAAAVESFFRSHGLKSFSDYPEHLTTFGYRH